MRVRARLLLVLAGVSALVVTGAASAGGTHRGASVAAPNIKQFCGTKQITVAQNDGFGENAWRKITHAEFLAEAKKCPNLKLLPYVEAGGSVQKYISEINSFVAQGANVIVTFDDFGSAALGALKQATRAGVKVVPYISNPGGTVGKDYVAFPNYNMNLAAKAWAQWLHKHVKTGNGIMLGGIPGNPASEEWLRDLKKWMKPYKGLKLLDSQPIDTNWDPAQYTKVMTGLFAKYSKIDWIAADYGTGVVGAIRAYVSAGKQIPPIVTSASDNQLGCLWRQYHKKNPNFQILSMDGTNRTVRVALRKALAAYNGKTDPEPSLVHLSHFIDTFQKPAPCVKSLPPDADLSSMLTIPQLKTLFGK